MFIEDTVQSPIRNTLHWVEQAFFALILLVGMGLGFYALVAPDSTYAVTNRTIELVEHVEPKPVVVRAEPTQSRSDAS